MKPAFNAQVIAKTHFAVGSDWFFVSTITRDAQTDETPMAIPERITETIAWTWDAKEKCRGEKPIISSVHDKSADHMATHLEVVRQIALAGRPPIRARH